MKNIAIIGAGVSGLATAIGLKGGGYNVVVIEKSNGVCGRAASRSRDGVRYDHGANYFKTDSPEVKRLVLDDLPRKGLVDIRKEVWTFDREGTIQPGDPTQNAEPKWTYTDGISTLGKRMAVFSEASFRILERVESLQRVGDRWRVHCDDEDFCGVFDTVVLTPPSPEVSYLVRQSSMDRPLQSRLIRALEKSHYHYQLSCVLAFDAPLSRPGDFFALVNSDREHPIAWLSFEDDKPGHVPEGRSVLVAQMAPEWCKQRIEEHDTVIARSVVVLVEELLGVTLPGLSWFDLQCWRFAHPFSTADVDVLREAESVGLYFAGDALVGQGRVARAMETGFECARRIRSQLS